MLDRMITKRQERSACRCPTRSTCWWFRSKPDWDWTRPSSTWRGTDLSHRDISEELSLVNLEMRAGKRRAEALRTLANAPASRS